VIGLKWSCVFALVFFLPIINPITRLVHSRRRARARAPIRPPARACDSPWGEVPVQERGRLGAPPGPKRACSKTPIFRHLARPPATHPSAAPRPSAQAERSALRPLSSLAGGGGSEPSEAQGAREGGRTSFSPQNGLRAKKTHHSPLCTAHSP
jgi:hypothetical protein